MRVLLVTCRLACRLALALLVLSVGGCLALVARGAVARPVVVRAPCTCGWSQPVPVASPVVPPSQIETGPR